MILNNHYVSSTLSKQRVDYIKISPLILVIRKCHASQSTLFTL